MNKQEAIEEIKKQSMQAYDDFAIMRDTAIYIVNQINEPEKPVVPEFVADWLEVCKDNLALGLANSMNNIVMRTNNQPDKTIHWLAKNSETFAKAWIYGYEVEKEKLYLARFRLLDDVVGECYINQTIDDKKFFLSNLDENNYVKVFFTQEGLKKLGLWENALIDTDEVKDD
ncbi:DUF1642 domain-containing protein [Streptococcus pasteurianus]|nr:DUF1642 domain-containing protein [Streptococcus pasteurianus]